MNTLDIHLRNVPCTSRYHAIDLAEHFGKQYPDNVGSAQGVTYMGINKNDIFYVYRTKGGRIVVYYDKK